MTDSIATTPDELPSHAEQLEMSGLEYMQRMQDGEISCPPIAGLMNYFLHSVEPGRVTFRGTPQFAHSNSWGAVHGGWYGALLDTCMGCAVMTGIAKGRRYTTLEYRINITRGIPPDTEVFATGILQHSGRSTAVARGEILGSDGALYATASTTCIVLGG